MAYLPLLLSKRIFFLSTLVIALLAALCNRYFSLWNPRFVCREQKYTTEIISLDPLVIYINNFVSSREAEEIIALGTPDLQTSMMSFPSNPSGQLMPHHSRTSSSAFLPPESPLINCILSRSRSFMGTLLRPDDTIGTPQLVQYQPTQKFDEHHDWYDELQLYKGGDRKGRWWWNRIGSFFVYLEFEEGKLLENRPDVEEEVEEGVGGETWFPYLEYKEGGDGKWRKYKENGIAFRPIKGNALFWMNLHQGNWTGDKRVIHAGLPMRGEGGRKTAMNIWPKKFFGPR